MSAKSEYGGCDLSFHDVQCLFTVAYKRLSLVPVGADKRKVATIVTVGNYEVRIIEIARPSETGHHPLRIDLFDSSIGHAIVINDCRDLDHARAIVGLLVGLARRFNQLSTSPGNR